MRCRVVGRYPGWRLLGFKPYVVIHAFPVGSMVYAENQWLGVYAVLFAVLCVFKNAKAQPLTVAGAALVGLGFVFWVRNKQTVQLPVKLR